MDWLYYFSRWAGSFLRQMVAAVMITAIVMEVGIKQMSYIKVFGKMLSNVGLQ